MEKFKIEVIKTDEFLVNVDSEFWNEEIRKEWSKTFWNLESNEDLAKSLAESVSRKGLEEFYEGFGYVKTLSKDGSFRKQWYKNKEGELTFRTDEDYTKGLSITILSMDNEIETNLIN
jgi:hypothetical protein